jgi:hypothetical protein
LNECLVFIPIRLYCSKSYHKLTGNGVLRRQLFTTRIWQMVVRGSWFGHIVPGTGTDGFAGWTGSARIVHDDQGAYFEINLA